jgi:WD40 repeat protein
MGTGELTNQPKSGVSGSMHLAFSPASGDLTGGFGYNSILSYNQDGTRFADASEDWRIGYCYTRVHTCDAVLYLKVHDGPVNSVAFSPDGKWAVSGSFDGIIDLWPGHLKQWKSMACRIAGRNLTRAEYAQYIDPNPGLYESQYAKHPTCPDLPVE